MSEFELTILDCIQEHMRNGVLDVIMPAVSVLGNAGAVWILMTVILLISKKHRRTGVMMTIALVVDLLLCNVILKNAVARVRPFDLNQTVELLVEKPTDYSFPSGHTAASFAATTALFFSKGKFWYLALILSVLIAFSRLYLYVHFPTDILGGIVVGILSGCTAMVLVRAWQKRQTIEG